ncbi:hypothetical protein MRX96_046248 [Rhipicephalus microplus]
MDNRTVTLASNFIAIEDEDSIRRWNKAEKCYVDVKRPAVINAHNHSMGGVDEVDFISLYRTTIRSRKWTLKMTFHIMNLAVVNAWLEYRRDADKHNLPKQLDLDFTQRVIEGLSAAGSKPVAPKRGRPSLSLLQVSKHPKIAENRPIEDVTFDQLGHFPLHDETRERRCQMEGCTGRTRLMCEICKVHLVITK